MNSTHPESMRFGERCEIHISAKPCQQCADEFQARMQREEAQTAETAPIWNDKSEAMLHINAIESMLGGANGPTIRLRALIEKEAQTVEPLFKAGELGSINELMGCEHPALFTHPTPPPNGERKALINRALDVIDVLCKAPKNAVTPLVGLLKELADMLAADAQEIVQKSAHLFDMITERDALYLEDAIRKQAQQVAVPQGLEVELIKECERAMAQRDKFLKTEVSTAAHGGSHDTCFGAILRKYLAAPQPPQAERVPLTPEQIQAGHDAADIAPTDTTIGTFIEGVRFAEANHGVKP